MTETDAFLQQLIEHGGSFDDASSELRMAVIKWLQTQIPAPQVQHVQLTISLVLDPAMIQQIVNDVLRELNQ